MEQLSDQILDAVIEAQILWADLAAMEQLGQDTGFKAGHAAKRARQIDNLIAKMKGANQ